MMARGGCVRAHTCVCISHWSGNSYDGKAKEVNSYSKIRN